MTSRAELQRLLAKLEADVPEMKRMHPEEGDFISEFAGHADVITDSAEAPEYEWALAEIDRMLTSAGYPPDANELPTHE